MKSQLFLEGSMQFGFEGSCVAGFDLGEDIVGVEGHDEGGCGVRPQDHVSQAAPTHSSDLIVDLKAVVCHAVLFRGALRLLALIISLGMRLALELQGGLVEGPQQGLETLHGVVCLIDLKRDSCKVLL